MFRKGWAICGEFVEEFNQPVPEYNCLVPEYNCPAPEYNRPAPEYNRPAPEYSRPALEYNHPPEKISGINSTPQIEIESSPNWKVKILQFWGIFQ